jgi:outer membrane immunogenic protein
MNRAARMMLAVVGFVTFSAAASAQSPSTSNWTGTHFGLFSGYAVGGHWKGTADDYPHQPVNGWFGGAAIGYDQQLSSGWVIGLEGDLAVADIKLTDNYFDAAATSRINYLGTLRPRVGYAWGGKLIYLTGGLAFGQMTLTINHWGVPPGSEVFQASDTQWHWGYAVGAGAEIVLFNNISLRAEYLWVDLQTQTYTLAPVPTTFTGSNRADMGWSGNTVKAGLTWRFH